MPALNVPQSYFMQMPHKFRAFVAGYGGGKTWVGSTAMCARFWNQPKVNQGYFAPTYPQIRDIFFPTIEEVAFGMGLRVECMEANKEVHFYSGRHYRGTTICRSMERPATIVGFKIGHALIDEFDVLEPKRGQDSWKKIIARLRWQGGSNGADITTTPEGFRTTHKLFVEDIQEDMARRDRDDAYALERPLPLAASYGLIQASTRQNKKNLPDGYIEALLDAYPAELRDAYIDGKFCNLTTGTVYRSYDRVKNNSSETIQPGEPLFVGMDFNIGKMAATIYVQRETGWHAAAELKDVFDTPTMARRIKSEWPDRRIVVYPDASGKSAHTVDATKSDLGILQSHGLEIRVNPSNPRVRDRVLSVNKQFETGKLWVNARACPTVAKNLEKQAYDESGEPDKRSGFDHQNDATGYPIVYEFPIIRPTRLAKVIGL